MKKINVICGLVLAAMAGQAMAESLPPIQLINPERVHLDGKEAAGVRLAEQWKSHPDRPRRGEDGSVKYLFGATLPTLVCSPLQVCSIRLQPGEVVSDVHVGDSVRWKITPATEGQGANVTTMLIVKATDAALSTNLLITTDRRVYTIKLVSTQRSWIPVLSFDYPEDVQSEWAAYHKRVATQTYNNTLPTGQNVANLDFNYRMSGDSPSWKPLRVYSDGVKTYIQFPSANFNSEAPALVALGDDGGLFRSPSQQIVNYRVIGDRYVVDKVLDSAALIVGVGSRQTKVTITHTKGGR
ncbi:P-type conjugative transfer protein TrbG [Tatumella sp. UCD-D_suzukii]|uniref:P-type conjugative transfer protein TrbG n=1 Tax=Tatumella sp. UCD-D_suzukii TaxID=1408192 RepID=UPI00046FC170|nr:P-type conjugative transfer protein TrbG [Tatumella sp. UCD-D_suzukii]